MVISYSSCRKLLHTRCSALSGLGEKSCTKLLKRSRVPGVRRGRKNEQVEHRGFLVLVGKTIVYDTVMADI